MALTYKKGEIKKRANIYQRFSTDDVYETGDLSGRVGLVVRSDWGDVDEVTILRSPDEALKAFGNGGTTDVIAKAFEGGAQELYVARLKGDGAENATAVIESETGTIKLRLKSPGEREIAIQLKPDLKVEDRRNFAVLENGTVIESFNYRTAEGDNEINQLVEVIGQSEIIEVESVERVDMKLLPKKQSETNPDTVEGVKAEVSTEDNKVIINFSELSEDYDVSFQLKMGTVLVAFQEDRIKLTNEGNTYTISFSEKAPYKAAYTLLTRVQKKDDKSYKTVVNTVFNLEVEDLSGTPSVIEPFATLDFTGGTSGTVTVESYADALAKLEKYRFTTFAADSVDEKVVALVREFVNNLYENGRYTITVIGTPAELELDEKIEIAKDLNNRNVVAVGSGYIGADGAPVDEAVFAAQIAGLIASTPSNTAITATAFKDSKGLINSYTNKEYEDAIDGGLLTLSLNENNEPAIEAGITTLTDLEEGIEDKGWMKIKRVRVRNEMFDRITLALAPKRSKLTPNDNGRSFALATITNVLDELVSENKIAGNYQVTITDENTEPDSVSYMIAAYDYDALEKFYLHYKFRYRENN